MQRINFSKIFPILIAGFSFSVVWSCVTAPQTGRKQLMLLPQDQMKSLGSEAYQEIQKNTKELANPKLVAAVKDIGKRLTAVTGQELDWEVKVFDSKEMNAFCLPGGKIGIYSGILEVAPTNATLAAIIGHEIAHATSRHGAERMSQALLAQGAMIATDISLSDKKYRNLAVGALGVGLQFGVLLPYSRVQESEADHVGTLYMAEAGYDPRAAVEVWQNMANLSKNSPPEFLSTHPHPETRIANLKKNMQQYLKKWRSSNSRFNTQKLPSTGAVSH